MAIIPVRDSLSEKRFDLNIEEILENWEVKDAIRELIANALDEQLLTGTEEVKIFRGSEGGWHIRDFGRGLRVEHFTQKENPEKTDNPHTIGKFGIGLKDAVATFDRKGITVIARSRHADFSFGKYPKAGFEHLEILHAVESPPSDPQFVGTDFVLQNCDDASIQEAKQLFLRFSGDALVESTAIGQVLEKVGDSAHIYVNGVKVSHEDNFLFSYNITSLDKKIKNALNRERTNVGRTAYTSRVKSILQQCSSPEVARLLVEDLERLEQGREHEEVKWTDIAVKACKILNANGKIVFMTPDEMINNAHAVDTAKNAGFRIAFIPQSIRERIAGLCDLRGNLMRDTGQLAKEFTDSFEFKFLKKSDLTAKERRVFAMTDQILKMAGGRPSAVKKIDISETMVIEGGSFRECSGLWRAEFNQIVIKRTQLVNIESYASTLLHEVAHARSGEADCTRGFEDELTRLLGIVEARGLERLSTRTARTS